MTPFEELFQKSLEIHKKKREDYTTNPDVNPYENFSRANELISWFPPEYKSFASHIGTKLARISSLLQNNRVPNNESLDDSFLDLVTYCGLMYGFYKSREGALPAWIVQNLEPDGIISTQIEKSKDAPDPTEPCSHENLDIYGICFKCKDYISASLHSKKYYRLEDKTYQKR
jgi:hypothetical protein